MTTGQTERTGQDGLPGPATGEGTARALTTLPACAMTFSTTRLFLLGALGLRLVANLGVSPTVPSSMLGRVRKVLWSLVCSWCVVMS
ncbi:hypothetical protein PV387_43125 [Streptomyces sp. ME02-6987-2C]|uniref:hypothetical protein n=1 Tax=unclassified Streptomyces TaxID=2593676 RepID=UPI0029BB4C5E|nr:MULTISPECIES: hypothetical protein [unclassified Streptomyces]MDX3372666.1 hypothetical protein [Streptomyces sp. ME02-6987-2C]MDX3419803.1 hypothetical protein [Streptomyces sp. ME02-6985-2c]